MTPSIPLDGSLNILLDDVEKELMVLITQLPEHERRSAALQFSPLPSVKEMRRLLGALDCQAPPSINVWGTEYS